MEELAKVIAAIKDVVIGVAAAVTAWVAVRGLNKWHSEMSGKNEYDVARNLMRATYRVRDELRAARTPMIWGNEFPDAKQDADGYRHVYTSRFTPVVEAIQEFDTNTLEAEALWGPTIRKATDELRGCVGELRAAMEAVLNDKATGGEDFKADREFGKRMRATVHDLGEAENQLGQRIRHAVKAIEDEIRPRMAPK